MTFDQLVQEIKDYDSDTFFAKGADLTHEEAVMLAENCISHFVNNRLDGSLLDCWLYDIRDKS